MVKAILAPFFAPGVFLGAMLAAAPAGAESISSAYTDLNTETDCTVVDAADPDEGGDWVNLVCDGYRGFPVLVDYADARESLFYGYPPAGDRAWESFDAFNNVGPRIEWRLAETDGRAVPFATIHRWFVSDFDDPDAQVEVLVVAKVGRPDERQGCAVGYVVASGNPNANVKARNIADNQVRDFVCGADQPTIDQGSVLVPPFTRQAN
jgi:hypothetical protein